jgi:signal transduction histidine kinase
VTAAGLPHVLGPRAVGAWLLAQTLALGALLWSVFGPISSIASAGAFGGFQLFAVAAASLALSESRAVQALASTNAELTATRELLAENTRVAERLRISRDLHDTLGHHLTALSIQLEVASRLSDGAAANHIAEAHAIAKLLLAEVRSVVSTLRGGSRIDLSQALRALSVVPGPLSIHLDMPERLVLNDAAQAHTLLRCVQEIITNTARHASAENLWITIAQRADGIDLQARDDGRGSIDVQWGNGLRGMRERFEEYAGRIEVRSTPGQGFEVRGFMPRPETA